MAPQITVRKNGGAPATGVISCVYGDTIRLRLAETGTVRSCRFEIYGYPPAWPAPSGWTEDTERRVIYADGVTPDDFTLPAELLWGKWLLRALVDGEIDDGVTALEITSGFGLHAMPAGEGSQFGGAAERWGKHLDENIRTINTNLGGGGGGELSGDVTGPTSATVVGKLLGYPIDFGGDPPIHGGLLIGEEVAPGDVRIRQLPSPPDDPPVMLVGAGLGPPSWTTFFPDFFAFTGIVGGDDGLSFGSSQIDVSGSGTLLLTKAQLATGCIRLVGTLTGNRVVQIPQLAGMRTLFMSEVTGNYTLRLEGVGGGFTYLLPRQKRMLHQDALTVLVCEASHVLATELTITITSDAVGDVARAIATLPGPFVVDRCEQVTLVNTAGGTSKSSVGQNPAGAAPQYSDLLAQVTTPAVGADPLGKASSSLGTAMATDGSAFFASTTTVFHDHNVSGSTVTGGKLRVFLVARYLGE